MVMPLRRADRPAILEESHRILLCSSNIVSRIHLSISKVQKYRVHCLSLLSFFFCFSISQVILKGAAVHYLLVEDLLLKLEGSVTSKWALNCGSWSSLFL